MIELYSDRLATPGGVFLITFSREGIYRLSFPGSKIDEDYPLAPLPWPGLKKDLKVYLSGQQVDWERYPLDCSGYHPFTAKLLQVVSSIPFGRILTYRQVAEKAGSPLAWRAAGQALKANRHPLIVPCHRVVGSGGKLGGFSGPPGWKRKLLNLENIHDYSAVDS